MEIFLRRRQPGRLCGPGTGLRTQGLYELRRGFPEAEDDGGSAPERAVPAPGAAGQISARGDGFRQGEQEDLCEKLGRWEKVGFCWGA